MRELIDRQTAIKMAKTYGAEEYDRGYARGKKDAQPGWIPCSTEMPPTGKNVLVTLVDGAVTDGNRWKPQEGKWFLFSDGVNGLDEDVLAWMPLPAPYRPEGDDKHEG